jgi:CubicO group peptidase (beta-lactamase class C family)
LTLAGWLATTTSVVALFAGATVMAEPAVLDCKTIQTTDAGFADFDRRDLPSHAVGVVEGGRLIFAKGYGAAKLDERIPITHWTVFCSSLTGGYRWMTRCRNSFLKPPNTGRT